MTTTAAGAIVTDAGTADAVVGANVGEPRRVSRVVGMHRFGALLQVTLAPSRASYLWTWSHNSCSRSRKSLQYDLLTGYFIAMDKVFLYQLTFKEYNSNQGIMYLFVSNEEAEQMRDYLLKEELRKIFDSMTPEEDASGSLVIRIWPWPTNKKGPESTVYDLNSINRYVNNDEDIAWEINGVTVEGVTKADFPARLEEASLRREQQPGTGLYRRVLDRRA